jgi:hypothetical protein
MAQGDVSLQNYNFIALHAFMACRGATSSYFCSFQMLKVQIPSRPMPFSTISQENNVSEKKNRENIICLGVWYRTSSLQMLKTIHKNPVSPSMFFFSTLFNVLSGI